MSLNSRPHSSRTIPSRLNPEHKGAFLDALLVSVIVPTLNRPDAMRATLRCLLSDNYPRLEIILVDQSALPFASSDNRVRVIHVPRPNLPRARNTGLAAAHGDIVLFLDDDVTFAPGLVNAHAEAHAAHPDAGCVTGRILLLPPHFWEKEPQVATLNPLTAKFRANFDWPEEGFVDFPVGCNMSFKREALEKTGLFDGNYAGNALYEEIDFVLRMKSKGFRVFFSPRAALTHVREEKGGCRSDDDSRYYFIKFRNTGYFFFKNLFSGTLRPFLKAMRDEIEFYTRTPGGHRWSRAAGYGLGLLWGAKRGLLKRGLG
ncbi:MAG: glycosyltransferase family 2 protein [Fibrobacterota bacterium]